MSFYIANWSDKTFYAAETIEELIPKMRASIDEYLEYKDCSNDEFLEVMTEELQIFSYLDFDITEIPEPYSKDLNNDQLKNIHATNCTGDIDLTKNNNERV